MAGQVVGAPGGGGARSWPLVVAGWLMAVPAAVAVIVGLALVWAGSDSSGEPSDDGLGSFAAVLGLVAVVIGAPGLVLGVGCIRRNRVLRVLAIVVASVLVVPFVRQAIVDGNPRFLLPALYPAGVAGLACAGKPARPVGAHVVMK